MKLLLISFAIAVQAQAAVAEELSLVPPGAPFTASGDLSAQMVAGIDRYLDRATADSVASRSQFWKRDFTSSEAYARSVAPNRERLRRMLGVVDARVNPVRMEYVSGPDQSAVLVESRTAQAYAVRWTVLDGVTAEGLMFVPKKEPIARMVLLPDADETPEKLALFALRAAEGRCEVLMPTLIDRQCTWSGNPKIVMTDQTHREWVWRPAYELGRHVIGFEVQKVMAAVDWLTTRGPQPVAVAGHGEGGSIALYAGALDDRIAAVLVDGYFQPRETLWSEPIYRNVWGLLREFGDAEIASLIAPRPLVIENGKETLEEDLPPPEAARRKCAAPGQIQLPESASIRQEVERARKLCTSPDGSVMGEIELITGTPEVGVQFQSEETVQTLLRTLGVKWDPPPLAEDASTAQGRKGDAPSLRQQRQVAELIEHCQRMARQSEAARAEYWKTAVPKNAAEWPEATRQLRDQCWNDVIGRLPDPSLPPNPRVRKMEERPEYVMSEVMLDVWPDVFAWGYLLVPKDIKRGERRPVVVCQHGLEGLPSSVIEEDEKSNDWRYYRAFARQLAARGFICFCPHNPYRGAFRPLGRKAHPLGLSLFSFILGQHQRELEWLASLPFVDAKRIGFYGLSYGGVSAVRLPALLDGYACSICSAAFNDWPRKITSTDFRSAYVFTGEYDIFSFNLANTFSNAELAALIAPRPFMVERGHDDGVAPDEWVAYEYAKVRRLYAKLGIPDRTEIEFFSGGHVIHGQGTFEFLHRHLNWPAPAK